MKRIEDYAFLSNGESSSLINKDGSIDWLTFPRFDSSACFAKILGDDEHGFWFIKPLKDGVHKRRDYQMDTLILENHFIDEESEFKEVICMVVGDDKKFSPSLNYPMIVRTLTGIKGQSAIHFKMRPRFDYGKIIPWISKLTDGRIQFQAGPDTLLLQINPVMPQLKMIHFDHHDVDFSFNLQEGEDVSFILTWYGVTHLLPPHVTNINEEVERTKKWWVEWCEQSTYQGAWKYGVRRSLLTLKGLIYQPTGAIIAAPTTSLPEMIGGARNWDYRYCWHRDSAFSLQVFLQAGYIEEFKQWEKWLLRSLAGTPQDLGTVYGIAGERRLNETILDWLPGFEQSRPVRIGNAAYTQLQLDIFGELMDVFYLASQHEELVPKKIWSVILQLLKYLESLWREADEGIWEIRAERKHFTYSKVMCWLSFDRAIKMVQQSPHRFQGPIDHWVKIKEEIFQDIFLHGFNQEINSFVQYYGSKEVDASLLRLSLVGLIDVHDPRMMGTIKKIETDLLHQQLVKRYRTESAVDGIPGGEGYFILCTLWLADNYILMGKIEEAEKIFHYILSLRNDVGLLSEEYDPYEKRFLGNFPQAFSHLGLLSTAFLLYQ